MQQTKAVGMRELKDRLSAFMRDVRQGIRVLVLDRGEVVGEICRPAEGAPVRADNPIVAQWLRDGHLTLAASGRQRCPPSPLRAADGTAQRLLDEERGE